MIWLDHIYKDKENGIGIGFKNKDKHILMVIKVIIPIKELKIYKNKSKTSKDMKMTPPF
jgi:hypothetical protein